MEMRRLIEFLVGIAFFILALAGVYFLLKKLGVMG
jgi:cbb3-type cytochrome oxidase subunit 3